MKINVKGFLISIDRPSRREPNKRHNVHYAWQANHPEKYDIELWQALYGEDITISITAESRKVNVLPNTAITW